MIFRTENKFFNPIREHLQIVPVNLPPEMRLPKIAEYLQQENFDPRTSRVLVFVTTRKKTEELAETFVALEPRGEGRVGAFHAGMSAEERDDTYRAFKQGELVVLFATKAFGMGMDIPNIHYVFHYEPPSGLEDYLQEVGRAGRDPGFLEQAGFSKDHPIQCLLFATPDDFKRVRDRLHRSQLPWIELPMMQATLHKFVKQIKGTLSIAPSEAIPLPLDLLQNSADIAEYRDASTRQRLGLHWLEQLQRIRLGTYLPAHLAFQKIAPETSKPDKQLSRELLALWETVAAASRNAPPDSQWVLIPTPFLIKQIGVRDFREVFKYIVQAQQAGLLRMYRDIWVEITQKRAAEVADSVTHTAKSPILEGVYAFVARMLAAIPQRSPLLVDQDFLQAQFATIAQTYYTPDQWVWIEDQNPENTPAKRTRQMQKDLADFTRRPKTLFKLMQGIPRVTLKTFIDDQDRQIKHLLRHRNAAWQPWLKQHKLLAYKLLTLIYQKKSLQGEKLNLVDVFIALQVPEYDLELFDHVLHFLKGMGYIRIYTHPLIPMAIEMFLHSRNPIEAAPTQLSADDKVYQDFEEYRQLRKLRLSALETLHALEQSQHQQFIQEYFACQRAQDILNVLETTLPANSDVLAIFREEALKEQEKDLSDEQLAIYHAPPGQSVMVVAGPGSGKTHVLLLRLARLIHRDQIAPNKILVLAYNRAVVEEIKHRLHDLLGKLGYRHLIRGLKVFTFHALIKYCLADVVRDVPIGDEWETRFLETFEKTPGLIRQRLGSLQYILVDEFHDITTVRYTMLQKLTEPTTAHLFVIGDPNQSIYGHQRQAAGDPREAEPYFERVAQEYQAVRYRLQNNYRSFPRIIQTAAELVALNHGKLSAGLLAAARTPSPKWTRTANYVERHNARQTRWFETVLTLLTEKKNDGAPYRNIAVLFRSNLEVYRSLTELKQVLQAAQVTDIHLRVQGDALQFARLREIEHFLDQYRQRSAEILPPQIVEDFLLAARSLPPCWHHEFIQMLHVLLLEFQKTRTDSATFGDLAEYIEEIGRSDAGQMYKLYQLWQRHIMPASSAREKHPTDIVLSSIHKVKGLEFDAVIIPCSIADLPFAQKAVPAEDLHSIMAEERRIYYVGMTRARDCLILFEWQRETCLQTNRPFTLAREQRTQLGIGFNSGIDNLFISQNANVAFLQHDIKLAEAEFIRYVETQIAIGDPLTFQPLNHSWGLVHQGRPIGILSKQAAKKLTGSKTYHGLEVTQIIRYYYAQSVAADKKNHSTSQETHFADLWSPYFRKQGWTYLIDFSGYAKPC